MLALLLKQHFCNISENAGLHDSVIVRKCEAHFLPFFRYAPTSEYCVHPEIHE